ncbi:type VI secretion system-associated FHA domain protein TagH [Ketobacter alkanivorans]|uniref:FHA domain-containing protein n=1 Tax=Ketobacter alkanivorans TaxID=1917421 RepID=A0A2K9LPW7_9GAMM|nr:type VI secretion system-associated FHA domain protein TagH [Ketobacter alkanivorans]AUM14332.1 hypothetical protein Kalk_18710 [Ketobacter alkanivorans]
MELVIEVVSTEKHLMGSRARHVFYPAGGVIGRSAECDWVIPDQTRHMSGRHAIISYESGQFFITDISTNGVFLNGVEALGKNRAMPLNDADRLLMGQIHFQVQVNAAAGHEQPAAVVQIPRPTLGNRPAMNSTNNPMEQVDQWAAEQAKATPKAEGWHQKSHSMPDDVAPQNTPFTPPKTESDTGLPENWWEEPAEPAATKTEQQAEPEEPLPGKGVIPPLPDWDEGAMHTAIAPITEARREDREGPLRALAEGLGVQMSEIEQAGGVDFLRRAGMLLRLCMRGLVSASQARASMKNEFRLDMTLVNMKDNNPIKLSANGEQAIKHMLAEDQGSFQPMDRAMQECFDDFQEHQLAMMAGMQGAFLELMDSLSPQALEKRFDKGRSSGLSIGSKNARYWESYRELHRDLLAEDDIFASMFAEPFARAYDEQMSKLKKTRNPKGK